MRKILVLLFLSAALMATASDLFERGREHYSAGRFEIALVTLLESLREEPENPDCYLFIGNIYTEKREFNRAIAYYRIGLDLTARPNIFHFNIGHALYYSRRYDEAIVSLRKALQGEQGIPGAWLELGRTYYQLSDKSNTIRSWQNYLRALPNNPQAATIRRAIELLSREDYLMPAERAKLERERLAEEEARRQDLRDRLAQALLEGEGKATPMIFTESDVITTVNEVDTESKDKDDFSFEEDIEK